MHLCPGVLFFLMPFAIWPKIEYNKINKVDCLLLCLLLFQQKECKRQQVPVYGGEKIGEVKPTAFRPLKIRAARPATQA